MSRIEIEHREDFDVNIGFTFHDQAEPWLKNERYRQDLINQDKQEGGRNSAVAFVIVNHDNENYTVHFSFETTSHVKLAEIAAGSPDLSKIAGGGTIHFEKGEFGMNVGSSGLNTHRDHLFEVGKQSQAPSAGIAPLIFQALVAKLNSMGINFDDDKIFGQNRFQ